jgi:hypothetical protein
MGLSDVWNAFETAVKDGLGDLIGGTVKSAAREATEDAEAFLADSRDAIVRWTDAAAAGLMTGEDVEFLLKGRLDLARMHALSAKGVAKARITAFKRGLSSLVLRAAFAAVGL